MSMQAYVATRKGLFELSFNGGRWEFGPVHFLGEPVSMVLPDRRDGSVYAALNLGHFGVKLHRKQGEIWTELPAPSYPPKPEGLEEKVEWTNKLIWSLEAGGADQPGVLWAGTLPGGLFHSNDRGDSWELVRPLWDQPGRPHWFGGGYDDPGIHSICVDPRDSASLLVGISCAGAWRSADGGASWALSAKGMRADYMPPDMQDSEEAQDPHRIVRCAGEPDVLWCQHHNGVWRSGDDGRSWQEIKNMPLSHFGFAVAAHPHDGQTAWFVPAEKDERRIPIGASLAVTRTRDGGKTFDVLRAGLPQEYCYDLVYRHGLAVHEDGRTLIMGSTTGNVWVSDNGGDSWHAVAGNLPPVYAVCFG